jgi:hypothetical protein
MRTYGRTLISLLVLGALGLLGAASATASTQVGATVPPGTGCHYPGEIITDIQRASPGNQYVVPSAGVITSWSVQSGSSPVVQTKLKLVRPAGGNDFTVVAESAPGIPSPGTTTTFLTRIPVSGGEILGRIGIQDGADCGYRSGSGQYLDGQFDSDPPVNTTNTYTGGGASDQVDVSATLEPDADGDKFGDETQDSCPTDATTQAPCVAPETTITSGPKSKTTKKASAFEFSSSVPGSTFECKLDDNIGFADCISPLDVKVGKGKHDFEVRAVGPGGTVDPTPATIHWTVKKKKKRNGHGHGHGGQHPRPVDNAPPQV